MGELNERDEDAVDRPATAPSRDGATSEPTSLPLFPLSSPLFPGMTMSLHIFENRYRRLLADRADADPVFGVVLTRSGHEVGDQPDIHAVGTGGTLLGIRTYDDGRSDIAVRGGRRFRVLRTDWTASYLVADVEWLTDSLSDADTLDSLAEQTRSAMARLVRVAAEAGDMPMPDLRLPVDPTDLGFLLARTLWLNTWERQELLELPTVQRRLERLLDVIRRERRLLTEAGASGVPIERPGSRFLPN